MVGRVQGAKKVTASRGHRWGFLYEVVFELLPETWVPGLDFLFFPSWPHLPEFTFEFAFPLASNYYLISNCNKSPYDCLHCHQLQVFEGLSSFDIPASTLIWFSPSIHDYLHLLHFFFCPFSTLTQKLSSGPFFPGFFKFLLNSLPFLFFIFIFIYFFKIFIGV